MTVAKKNDTQKYYHEQINVVLHHIQRNLDKDLKLQEIAQEGNYSVYHFHRIMRAYLGESLGSYVMRIRMENSATLLRSTAMAINEIALKVGYDNPASFNKAFKKRFGTSPGDYREKRLTEVPIYGTTLINRIMETINLKPTVKTLKPKQVIYVQSQGAYNESASKAWDKVCEFAKQKRLFGFKTEFIGISYDDPQVTETGKLRYEACVTTSKSVDPEGEIGVKEIAGGKYAIFTHKGPYENFSISYDYIFGKWIPENGVELRDEPCLEKYLNTPDKTKPEKLKTEILVPIK